MDHQAVSTETVVKGPDISVVVPCYNESANVAPLVKALEQALTGRRWEVIFVDDNSPDHTSQRVRDLARNDARVRGICRIGRRGLSSAVIEGALSSSAQVVAVMDGDLQHDESRLGALIDAVLNNTCDVAVGSRHVEGGNNAGLANAWRHVLSDGGIWLAQRVLPVKLTDPMSGFFALRQETFAAIAPRLSGTGFKILLDLLLSAPKPLRVQEVPCGFRPRVAGKASWMHWLCFSLPHSFWISLPKVGCLCGLSPFVWSGWQALARIWWLCSARGWQGRIFPWHKPLALLPP